MSPAGFQLESNLMSEISIKNVRLKDRAQMFKKARQFFDQRGIIEVDCLF